MPRPATLVLYSHPHKGADNIDNVIPRQAKQANNHTLSKIQDTTLVYSNSKTTEQSADKRL
jgi:predicted metalloenzyme YecM